MKIIQVCEHFRPAVDGLTNHVYNLSYNLSKKHEITVFTSDIVNGNILKIKRAAKNYEKVSDTFEVFRFKAYPPAMPYAKTYATIPSLIRNLFKSDADVIHTHSYMLLHSDITSVVSKLKKTPLVLTVHAYGSMLSNPYKDLLAKLYNSTTGKVILNCADKIIALNPEALIYLSDLGVEDKKIELIPNGIDYGKFANPNSTTGFREKYDLNGKIILFVGLLQERKGVQHLLNSAPQLLKAVPDANFIIVGDGELKRDLKRLSERLEISDKVKFTGFLPDKELLEAYASADVFAFPSAFEGLPTVIIEAMASGKPVVATNVGGIPSLVKDGITGFLVNYGDVNQLANVMTTILKDESLAKRMGENGRKAAKDYDWSIIGKKVEKLYQKVIGES
jgi:glycosyltransferase involved in cell wall biosynthesis